MINSALPSSFYFTFRDKAITCKIIDDGLNIDIYAIYCESTDDKYASSGLIRLATLISRVNKDGSYSFEDLYMYPFKRKDRLEDATAEAFNEIFFWKEISV